MANKELASMRPAALVFAILAITVSTTALADDDRDWRDERTSARSDVELAIGTMQRTALEVRELLRDTRKKGTKVQVTCLDDALSRVDVALRRARENGAASLAGYDRGDVEAARTHRRRVAEWREAQRLAAIGAKACVPAAIDAPVLAGRRTATKVTLVVDPHVARADEHQ